MNVEFIQEAIGSFLIKSKVIGLNLFIGLLVFAGFLAAGAVLRRAFFLVGRKFNFEESMFMLLGKFSFAAVSIFGVFFALGSVGVNATAIVTSLGLTGFAVGFALRDALSNILAGVLIILYKTFRLGDRIIVTGFEGKIVNIDLRYTTIESEDRKVLIPNASMFANPVAILKRKE